MILDSKSSLPNIGIIVLVKLCWNGVFNHQTTKDKIDNFIKEKCLLLLKIHVDRS